MQLPPPAVFHDKAKRTQQGNLLILVAIDIMVKIIISHGHHCHHGLHHHSHQYRQEKLDSQERQIKHLNFTFQVTSEGQLSQFLQCFDPLPFPH